MSVRKWQRGAGQVGGGGGGGGQVLGVRGVP